MLEHHHTELIAEFRLGVAQLLGCADSGLVEAEASLDADDEQIEHVRQTFAKQRLALLDAIAQPEVGKQESEPEAACINEERGQLVEAGCPCNGATGNGGQEFGAVEHSDRALCTVACADQPGLDHRDFGLRFGNNTVEVLNKAANGES